ncbi:MAG: hypothetical protein L6Q83_09970 [Gammaproteobacteria bacterium]|jgi:uncharacterized membrane protein YeiB|nr:hypothetical protein [Gammaproteobacteria bacterium]
MDITTKILVMMVLSGNFITLFMDLLATGPSGLMDRSVDATMKWAKVALQLIIILLLSVILWIG